MVDKNKEPTVVTPRERRDHDDTEQVQRRRTAEDDKKLAEAPEIIPELLDDADEDEDRSTKRSRHDA